MEIDGLLAIV